MLSPFDKCNHPSEASKERKAALLLSIQCSVSGHLLVQRAFFFPCVPPISVLGNWGNIWSRGVRAVAEGRQETGSPIDPVLCDSSHIEISSAVVICAQRGKNLIWFYFSLILF